jgi:hypothetical protein
MQRAWDNQILSIVKVCCVEVILKLNRLVVVVEGKEIVHTVYIIYSAYRNMSLYVNAQYIFNHSRVSPLSTTKPSSLPLCTGEVNRGDLVFTYLYDSPNTPGQRKPYRLRGESGVLSKVFTSIPHVETLSGQIRVAGVANSASTIANGRDLEASIQITGQCQLRIPSMRIKVQVGDALYINAFRPLVRDNTKGDYNTFHYVPEVYTVPAASGSIEKMISDAVRMYTDFKHGSVDDLARMKTKFFESCIKPHSLDQEVKYHGLQEWKRKQTDPYYRYFKTLTLCIAWVLSEDDGKPDSALINQLIRQSVENHRDYYIGTCIETATFPFCAVICR